MIRTILFALMIAATSLAWGQSLPKHYPAEGFNRTGLVDAVYPDENRIVINDMPFAYSSSIIVHSLSLNRAHFSRVRSGVRVAYKMGKANEITELWLLPANYSDARGR